MARAVLLEPDAGRAARLDEHLRLRLAASLAHVFDAAAPALSLRTDHAQRLCQRVRAAPVNAQAFGAYYELVPALEAGDEAVARACVDELHAALDEPVIPGVVAVRPFTHTTLSWRDARVQRLVDTDPAAPLRLRAAVPSAVDAGRAGVTAALALADSAAAELGLELRTLVREVILAADASDAAARTFDGASSFMLWGTVVVNTEAGHGRLAWFDRLVHESGHQLLFGLCADGGLVEDDDGARYPSPLRAEPRPMDGIVHAAFVSARVHGALRRLLAGTALDDGERAAATAACREHARHVEACLLTIDAHARLTELGRQVIADVRHAMRGTAT